METLVINTRTLPPSIRTHIHAPKVIAIERHGDFILSPISEGSGLRGMASQSKLTTEKMLAHKEADKELELSFGQMI